MNKKQLAEMIKDLRNKKLKETIGKPGPLNPVHYKATHGEDPESPNQYAHKIKEARVPAIGKSTQGKGFLAGEGLKSRSSSQRSGNQKVVGRFLNSMRVVKEKEELDLGSTDTGKNGKESETVDVNPTDNTALAKGELNKNTTVKETKEK